MLYYQAIDSETLELLKQLLSIEQFKDMRLVGGTSLALQIGHRKSIDLDLFGKLNADEYEVYEALNKIGKVKTIKKTRNINVFSIDGIKVDIVNYYYDWLEEVKVIDSLRISGISDIAAMKLSAITGRGTKKDFVDLYFLLNYFSIKDILGYYNKKYYDGSEFLVLKSMTYFVDAEMDEMPIMIKDVDWRMIKSKIIHVTEDYLRRLN